MNAVTGTPSSAVTERNETPTPIGIPREMNTVTGGNETPMPEEKIKEIQAEIKKKHQSISACARLLYVAAYKFTNRMEGLRAESSPQTMLTDMQADEKSIVLKRKHDDQQGLETFKEDVEPMTAKNSTKDSAETCALTGSIQKLDLQGKDMSDLQEETEKQKSDSGITEHNIKKAVRIMAVLRGSSSHSDSDYAVFRNLKGSQDDHFRDLLRQSGVLGSTEATMEGGKKEINADCVIQRLAKCRAKEMQQAFFGSKSVLDPSNYIELLTIKFLDVVENHTCDLYRLYLAEELEKNKMVINGTESGDMNAAKAITGGNETPSSAVTGRNEMLMPTSIGIPREMNAENAVTKGNETPTPACTFAPEENIKEIQAEIKKKHRSISSCTHLLYIAAYRFRRRMERLRAESSPQTMLTDIQADEKSIVLKRKHDNQQGLETFKEDVEPMTAKNSTKDSAETCALTGSIQKLDLQGKDMSDLQEETEKQKSDSGITERNIKKAVRIMAVLRGSSSHSDSDYAVFRNLKGSQDDHFRDLLRQSGVLGSTEATMEGGKKEINADCVIQRLAKCRAKEMQQAFFGSKSVLDPSNYIELLTIKFLDVVENHTCDLYRLYLAEELERNKMVNNGTDLSEA